jgi:hypothetical protein
MHIGLRMKRKRPMTPMYLERQPADHKRTVKQLEMHCNKTAFPLSQLRYVLLYYTVLLIKIATVCHYGF